jgi:membrane protein DedA with SNARE-associated domain
MAMTTNRHAYSLGPIKLAPGITSVNALTFLYAAFIGITLNTFVNFIQPYVLTEQLHVAEAEQGSMSGTWFSTVKWFYWSPVALPGLQPIAMAAV